jgi:hypothetical protein
MADIKVNPFRDGDPDYQIVGTDGKTYPGGDTIAEWKKRLGGDEGQVSHPLTKRKLHLSLKPYAHLDPNKTRLQIAFRNDAPHPSSGRSATPPAMSGPSHIAHAGKRMSEFLKKR